MYQQLAKNLYLVHNGKEYNDVWDARWDEVLPEISERNRTPDPVELLYPNRVELMADYPILVVFDGMEPTIIPIDKAIGGLGNRHILDFSDLYQSIIANHDADTTKVRLMSVYAKRRVEAAHVALACDPMHPQYKDNGIKVEFTTSEGDDGSTSQGVDVTQHILGFNSYGPRFNVVYCPFNHYDFLESLPELREFSDTRKWRLEFNFEVDGHAAHYAF